MANFVPESIESPLIINQLERENNPNVKLFILTSSLIKANFDRHSYQLLTSKHLPL